MSARSIVALAGLASAFQAASFFQAAPAHHSLPRVGRDSGFGFEGLSGRAELCLAGQVACGTDFCMPENGTCCDGIRGTFCNSGDYCLAQGCCRRGTICEGSAEGGCPAGQRQCGTVCIPGTSACCSSDRWCDSPLVCGTDGMCVSPTTSSSRTIAITITDPASTSSDAAASAARSATQTESSPASTSSGAAASPTRSAASPTRSAASPTRSAASPTRSAVQTKSSPASTSAASPTRSATQTASSPATNATGDAGRGGGNGNGDINRGGGGSTQDENKTPVGVIVGSVVGGLAGLALVGLGIALLLRHNKKPKDAVQTQTFQQQPPSPMQQYQEPSPSMPGASPAQGTGSPPPQAPPSPPPQRVYTAYHPSMATATYSTDPPPPVALPTAGHLGAQQGGAHEMSAKPSDDHRGQIHELA